MQYSISIDLVHSTEWGLNGNEAILFSWLYSLPSWAEKISLNNETYFFASRNKAISDLPLLTDRPDTIYRHYKKLESKGLIFLERVKNKDYVALTDLGKKWMQSEEKEKSEKNPSVGNFSECRKKIHEKSEKNPSCKSEIFPTYSNTISNTDTNTIKDNNLTDFDFFWNLYDKKVGDKDKLIKKWGALKPEERNKALDHIPKYKKSQPDKKYRKDPQTYLNNKSWNDEIIESRDAIVKQIFQNEVPNSTNVKIVLKG